MCLFRFLSFFVEIVCLRFLAGTAYVLLLVSFACPDRPSATQVSGYELTSLVVPAPGADSRYQSFDRYVVLPVATECDTYERSLGACLLLPSLKGKFLMGEEPKVGNLSGPGRG